jgi:hypothetical protein
MNRRENSPEDILDLLVDDIRNEPIDTAIVEESSRRVWERMSSQTPRSNRLSTCPDFQALMPAYRDGSLAAGRRMLLEDHTRACANCRKQLYGETAEPSAKVVEMPVRRMTRGKWMAVAASGTIALVFGNFLYEQFAPAPGGSRAIVQATDGSVYRLQDGNLMPVSTGAQLGDREFIRTAAGSRAVIKLMDGSVVEVGDRAELGVSARRRDIGVTLNRGAIIVQAAKRREGHLYVQSGDSRVSVTGTVFSVNRGAKGTRVSVVEGEVVVQRSHNDKVLHSGDQLATHSSMQAVPVSEEIAWSRNAREHLNLLQQMVEVKKNVESIRMPASRYSSRLMASVPANAVVFLSIPNARETFEDAQRLFNSEMQRAGANADEKVADVLARIARFSDYLGEEFVLAAVRNGREMSFVAIADVHRPGLKQFLDSELAKEPGFQMQIVEGDEPVAAAARGGMAAVIRNSRIVFGADANLVNAAFATDSGFAGTAFGQRIAQSFQSGTGILLAADLNSIIQSEAKGAKDTSVLNKVGGDGVRYLIAEQKTFHGRTQHAATLTFNGPRHGLASWLAAPGPMGGLAFVTSRAQFAASVITKDPRQMIEELFALVEAQGAGAIAEFEKMQRDLGIDLRQDIAGALGSEATIAIDGPLLPTPSWKLILEVNQPDRLQQAMVKMVSAANTELQKANRGKVQLDTVNTPEGVVYRIHMAGLNDAAPEIFYAYREGYLIAAPTQEMIGQAVQTRAADVGLNRSGTFRNLLPTDQNANFSALVYQNARETAKFLANLAPDPQKARELADNIGPTLIGAYADADRIQVTTFGSSMDLLMQTAMAPMFHGQHGARKQLQKRGTSETAPAYR